MAILTIQADDLIAYDVEAYEGADTRTRIRSSTSACG